MGREGKEHGPRNMKVGDIVECQDYGTVIILAPCQVPEPVPEDLLDVFREDPDAWPTGDGWSVQLLQDKNKVMSVHPRFLTEIA